MLITYRTQQQQCGIQTEEKRFQKKVNDEEAGSSCNNMYVDDTSLHRRLRASGGSRGVPCAHGSGGFDCVLCLD